MSTKYFGINFPSMIISLFPQDIILHRAIKLTNLDSIICRESQAGVCRLLVAWQRLTAPLSGDICLPAAFSPWFYTRAQQQHRLASPPNMFAQLCQV